MDDGRGVGDAGEIVDCKESSGPWAPRSELFVESFPNVFEYGDSVKRPLPLT